jgi:hypothetical protein
VVVRRIALGIALLLASAVVRAQEDDDLLEAEPAGPGISERLDSLEREWDRDVGVADPVEEGHAAEADPDRRIPDDAATGDEGAADHDAAASEDPAGKKQAPRRSSRPRKASTEEAAEKRRTPPSTVPAAPEPDTDSE